MKAIFRYGVLLMILSDASIGHACTLPGNNDVHHMDCGMLAMVQETTNIMLRRGLPFVVCGIVCITLVSIVSKRISRNTRQPEKDAVQ